MSTVFREMQKAAVEHLEHEVLEFARRHGDRSTRPANMKPVRVARNVKWEAQRIVRIVRVIEALEAVDPTYD